MRPRIRSVKQETFSHELLWHCEHVTGLPIVRCYIALWTMTDRRALFEWKPRALKTYCAPYDAIDFEEVLNVLSNAGFVVKYAVAGRAYGWIPRFLMHQSINGREEDSRLPLPPKSTQAEYERRHALENFDVLSREELLAPAPFMGGDPMQESSGVGPTPEYRHPDDALVYYARDRRQVKIGCSKNPWARVAELRTARPGVTLIATEPGGYAREAERHRQFSAARLDGEWFRWTPELEAHVAALGEPDDYADAGGDPTDDPGDDDSSHASSGDRSNGNGRDVNDLGTRGARVMARVEARVGHAPQGEGKGTEGKGTEGKDLPTLPPDGGAVGGNGRRDLPAVVGHITPLSLDGTEGSAQALPAIVGERTAPAIIDRLGRVMAEVADGARRRLKKEQLRKLQAEIVFAYWISKTGRDAARTRLDDKRERAIVARLSESGGDVSECLYAIDAAAKDPHLSGQNDRGNRYDTIGLIFRDREHVEELANRIKKHKEGKPHDLAVKYADICTISEVA